MARAFSRGAATASSVARIRRPIFSACWRAETGYGVQRTDRVAQASPATRAMKVGVVKARIPRPTIPGFPSSAAAITIMATPIGKTMNRARGWTTTATGAPIANAA